MFTNLKTLLFTFLVLLVSKFALANNVLVLNQNFESDFIPLSPGFTTAIPGWVNSGVGNIGAYIVRSNSENYLSGGKQAQVAYLDAGGRISQTTGAVLVNGETYTLTFDHGWRNDQIGQHFVARLKASGIVLAQLHSDNFAITKGRWSTETLSFVADKTMPLNSNLVIEFQNVALVPGLQANVDNVFLNIEGTGEVILHPAGLGSVNLIKEDTVLNVPETYATIQDALDSLNDKRVLTGNLVTISVSDCSNETYTQPLTITHPNASAIHILGNTTLPESCVIQFNGSNGIEVNDGNILGSINGFTLQGDYTPESIGFYASYTGKLNLGSSVLVRNFDKGVAAEYAGHVFADRVISENNTRHGFYAYSGAYISANYAISRSNSHGFMAEGSAFLEANNAEASSNSEHGYIVLSNSTMLANDSLSKTNSKDGYHSSGKSLIEARRSESTDNDDHGFYATDFSHLLIWESVTSLNSKDYYPSPNSAGVNHRSMIRQ